MSVIDKFAAFRSVDDAAAVAVEMLAGGERLRDVWRHAIIQMLDDYSSVLRHQRVDAAARMWLDEPRLTGDTRVDAAFAALGEYLARRDHWSVPAWTAINPAREARPWWFVTELRGMHPRALLKSPSSFRRRGVFIDKDGLGWV
jgi:hypothetical protein